MIGFGPALVEASPNASKTPDNKQILLDFMTTIRPAQQKPLAEVGHFPAHPAAQQFEP
jgi:hypothetical protein